ncbi:IS3 family transposase [Streptomyces sp. NPDC056682]|uniref:IS3 family transposase n=1 Tax=Streptomyces sp. NPDC056682 TaxID=3345909 RepID=UPI003683EBB2
MAPSASSGCAGYPAPPGPGSTGGSGAEARAGRVRADAVLAERITAIHAESDGTYGAPRVTAELRDAGVRVHHERVARVMRARGIVGPSMD